MARFDSMNRGNVIIKGAFYNKELDSNFMTIITGHIYNFLSDEDIDNSDDEACNT